MDQAEGNSQREMEKEGHPITNLTSSVCRSMEAALMGPKVGVNGNAGAMILTRPSVGRWPEVYSDDDSEDNEDMRRRIATATEKISMLTSFERWMMES